MAKKQDKTDDLFKADAEAARADAEAAKAARKAEREAKREAYWRAAGWDGQDPNLKNLKFAFAKTVSHIPHYYVRRSPENELDYVRLFCTVHRKGIVKEFRDRPFRYWYPGDGFKYWTMTWNIWQSRIINRTEEGNE